MSDIGGLLAGLLTSVNPQRHQVGKQRGDHRDCMQQGLQRTQRA